MNAVISIQSVVVGLFLLGFLMIVATLFAIYLIGKKQQWPTEKKILMNVLGVVSTVAFWAVIYIVMFTDKVLGVLFGG